MDGENGLRRSMDTIDGGCGKINCLRAGGKPTKYFNRLGASNIMHDSMIPTLSRIRIGEYVQMHMRS
jgi:hypothetical protein